MPLTFRSIRPLLVAAAAIAGIVAVPAAANAKGVAKGPADDTFYTPSEGQLKGKPGSIIWQREVSTGPVHLSNSARTTLVLYRSLSVSGNPIAVSGTVDIPRGKAPKGGFKVISYAHGTTGMADVCAPSRNTASAPAYGYIAYSDAMLNRWLKKGFAVVRTDYEGLGTPGDHPYLIGDSEGRGVVDIVQAARSLDSRLSKNYVIAGHSQGGQAALFAAQGASKWARSLSLKGTLAFAPASHIYDQKSLLANLKTPSGLSGLAAMILTSAARSEGRDPADFLSAQADAFLPQLDTVCTAQINQTDSFGGLAPSSLLAFDDGSLDDTLKAMNPDVKSNSPIAILQGEDDGTVFKFLTDQLKGELIARKNKLEYKTYPGLDHSGVVTNEKSQGDATAWIAARLR